MSGGIFDGITDLDVLDVMRDAFGEWLTLQGVPLPVGSHLRVGGGRREDVVMIRSRATFTEVLTSAGAWRALDAGARLSTGHDPVAAGVYARRAAQATADMVAALESLRAEIEERLARQACGEEVEDL